MTDRKTNWSVKDGWTDKIAWSLLKSTEYLMHVFWSFRQLLCPLFYMTLDNRIHRQTAWFLLKANSIFTWYSEALDNCCAPCSTWLEAFSTFASMESEIIQSTCLLTLLTLIPVIILPYNGYILRLEIFAIWAQKRSILIFAFLIFAFLIFAIPFNRKKWLIDNYFHTWSWFSSAVKNTFKKAYYCHHCCYLRHNINLTIMTGNNKLSARMKPYNQLQYYYN